MGRSAKSAPPTPARPTLWGWLKELFVPSPKSGPGRDATLNEQEAKLFAGFSKHYGITFVDPQLLKLALTHRSYLSVTGQGPRESNERLEFLGDSVLGLVTSEFLYRAHPTEHEGQLTKTKSLLVSKAILSRRALAMGLGRFVLMSHSEVESGGRQRLSILADAFESVVGAIYLDQGFEAARQFIIRWLLSESREIAADKRHTNYKSHLQEFVQSTFRTHPVYRIRSEMGPDHSKQFNVEVLVGRRVLGVGRGRNKKEAEQAAARDGLEKVENRNREQSAREGTHDAVLPPVTASDRPSAGRGGNAPAAEREREPRRRRPAPPEPDDHRSTTATIEPDPERADHDEDSESEERGGRRRGRRGGRGRRRPESSPPVTAAEPPPSQEAGRGRSLARPLGGMDAPRPESVPPPVERPALARRGRSSRIDDDLEEIGRPEGPLVDDHETVEQAPMWAPPRSPRTPVAPPSERERSHETEREVRRERSPEREREHEPEREREPERAPVRSEERSAPPVESSRTPAEPARPASPPARPEGSEDPRFGRRPGRSRRGGR